MTQYLKIYGEQLVQLGYTVLPIKPGTKRPDIPDWPRFNTTIEQASKWASNGRAGHGVGINARNTPAIDVDVLDPVISAKMAHAIERIFPNAPLLVRTGQAPKFLIPFRSETPFRKLTSKTYTDGQHDHKVEILGDGQQWVAYACHPSGRDYEWFDGVGSDGISTQPLESLHALSREDALSVIAAFESLAAVRVSEGAWSVKHSAVQVEDNRHVDPDGDPFAAHAEKTDLTRVQVEQLIHKVPSDDRDDWLRVGRMVHHHYEGNDEGFDVWDAWSANSQKYNEADQCRVWDSFGQSNRNPETLRSLMKEVGQPPKEGTPAAPHPQAKEGDRVPFVEGALFAANFEDIDWVIEDVVPRAQVGVVYGASGSGKTFFALDMACAVHRGVTWRHKHVERADTFYVAAEAGNGIKKRIAAYIQHKGQGPMPWFVDYQPNLATLDSVYAITESVNLRSSAPGLIFLDTLALSHDGDENSSKDMSLLLRHCKMLSDATGAMVVLIHHTGKDESKGMRGSSSLYAGADFVLEILAKGQDHTMYVDKLKDGERGAQFGFSLPAVKVGETPRGKAITSCYVKDEDLKLTKEGAKPLTVEAQIYIYSVFQESLGMATEMTETELVEAVKEKQRSEENVPSQSQSIKKSIGKMVISGHICKVGERLSLPHSTHSGSFASSE